MSRGLGLRGRDAHDPRDVPFAAHHAASSPIPVMASVDDASVIAKNQLSTSSCVGNATAQALRLSYLKRGVPCPDLSALFVYRIARNIDGTAGDEGSYLRSGCRAVQKLGCAPESAWPFSEAAVNEDVPFLAEHAAFDRGGLRSYYRIQDGDTDGVKRALAAGLAVTGGWNVDDAFCSSDGRTLIDAIRGEIVGGHAMCVAGYDHDVFTILGSWGSDYGHAGRIRITKAFVAQGSDFWAFSTAGGVS